MRDFFLVAIAGFAGGIFVSSYLSLGYSVAAAIFLLGVCLFLVKRARVLDISPLLPVLLIALSFGVARFQSAEIPREFDTLLGERVSLEGHIVRDVDVRETGQLVVFLAQGARAKISIFTDAYPRYQYGDRLKVSGVLKKPEDFSVSGGRTFDYETYLEKDGILYQVFRPQIEILARGEGSVIYKTLFAIKRAFLEKLSLVIPEPAAGLAAGELLGVKQALGKELLAAFVATSVVHVVVLSGFNITVIGEWIMRGLLLVPRLSRKGAYGIAGIFIVLFVLMTGAEAPAVRAMIIALIGLFGRATGRAGDATRLLIVAGALMLLHNPKLLVFDPAFQLSFVATLGLIHLTPHIVPYVRWIRWIYLRDIVSATVAAQVAVLPLLLYMTGIFSVVSFPANVLTLMAVPISMGVSFATGVLAFVSPLLAAPAAWVATLLLNYQIAVVEFFAGLPFATYSIPVFGVWVVWVVYAASVYFLRKSVVESRHA